MKSYDCSLKEVWEWKEQVYEQVKGCTPAEYIEKIGTDAKAVLNEHGVTRRITFTMNYSKGDVVLLPYPTFKSEG